MEPVEAAWLAGLYEGEGSLLPGSRGGWELSITMTDQDVIERAARVSGVGTVTYVKAREGWSDKWRWRVMKRDAIAAIATEIIAWLGTRRRERVTEFLHWYALRTAAAALPKPPPTGRVCGNGHDESEGGRPCRVCARDRQRRCRSRRATVASRGLSRDARDGDGKGQDGPGRGSKGDDLSEEDRETLAELDRSDEYMETWGEAS